MCESSFEEVDIKVFDSVCSALTRERTESFV